MIDNQEGFPINFNSWKIEIGEDDGVDPFDDGKSVLFTQEIYNELYFLIKTEQEAKSIIDQNES